MMHLPKWAWLPLPVAPVLLLTGCFAGGPAPRAPSAQPDPDMVAAIRAAGTREKSIIDVAPLRDPGVATLRDSAQAEERAGRYAEAATRLDRALRLSPRSPDLLQDRAELAVQLKDYAMAERLAHRSWLLGPQLGSLCARNWQTIVEMRLQANDPVGAATARKSVQRCHKEGIHRY